MSDYTHVGPIIEQIAPLVGHRYKLHHFLRPVLSVEKGDSSTNTKSNEWDKVVGDLRDAFVSAPYRLLKEVSTTWPMSFYGGCKGIRVAKKRGCGMNQKTDVFNMSFSL